MGVPASFPLLRTRGARLVAFVLALALAGFIAPVMPADAAPAAGQEWMSLSALQAQLATSPAGLPGRFKTVVGGPTDAQQLPVTLPLTVLGVVAGAGPSGPLLLVRLDLTDPVLARAGGLASGMSGSPIYVGDRLVGALSYGEEFTTDGLALATPVEDMMKVEAYGLAGLSAAGLATAADDTPRTIPEVRIDGRTISKIVVDASGQDPDKSAASAAAKSGIAHFTPLLGVQIGGLPVRSEAYRRLATNATERGLAVLAPQGSGSRGGTATFGTPIVPGAAAGAFLSLGAVSYGAIGTVTYTTADNGVLAFGHPLMWNGHTAMFFTNAWIDGVWSSALVPYKLGSPGRIRGTLSQDRGAAVGALQDETGPTPIPVKAIATVRADGRTVRETGETQVAPVAFVTGDGSYLVAAAAVEPAYRAADVEELPGSAHMHLKVVVNDGKHDYTVDRTNHFDASGDVLGDPAWETYRILDVLRGGEPGEQGTIKSVDMTSDISSARARATIVGVSAARLRAGRNTVTVSLKPLGSAAEKPVSVSLTIPAGTPLDGTVTATPATDDDDGDDEDELRLGTVADRVAAVNKAPSNADVLVSYIPRGGDDGDDEDDDGDEDEDAESAGPAQGVRVIQRTSFVVDGEARAETSRTRIERSASTIVAGQSVRLQGTVSPAVRGNKVKVERRTSGSTAWRTLHAALPLTVRGEGQGTFRFSDRPKANSVYRVSYPGSRGVSLGSVATIAVAVRGAVRLSSAQSKQGFILTSAVAPRTVGARIAFQRLQKGTWRSIGVATTGANGVARLAWKAPKGTHSLRAVFRGTPTLTGNTSKVVRVTRG